MSHGLIEAGLLGESRIRAAINTPAFEIIYMKSAPHDFGTTTLSHWDRNFVPNDNNFVPNHHWCGTQLLSRRVRLDLDLRSRETQLLSNLGHSSWPADRFGTQLLAHSHRYTSLICQRQRNGFFQTVILPSPR